MELHGNEKEFFRLMGYPLPCSDLYRHYLEMMSQYLPRIKEEVKAFNEYVQWTKDMGYSSPQNYRIDHAMGAFAKWVANKDPFMDIEYPKNEFKSKDVRDQFVNDGPVKQRNAGLSRNIMNGEHQLMSFDLKQANYSTIRLGMKQKGEFLPSEWSDFCDRILRIHPFLTRSKVFRQYCFGNYRPKVSANVQKSLIQDLVEKFDLFESAVYISSDEIVMPFEKAEELHRKMYDHINESVFSDAMSIKTSVYEMYRLDQSGDCLMRIVYSDGIHEERLRELFAVPRDRYYMYYRKHILGQELQENDLVFTNDGMKAKWIIQSTTND